MIEFKYRPDVDGLRAVAVCLVLLFHAGLGFPGGYVGVDVFLVISGFLITGLIVKEQAANTFSLAEFWARRIKRIIPAATLVGVVCLAVGACILLPGDLVALSKSLVAQQLMLSNLYFWNSTGYFDGASETMPLLHMWSLAVEEQFYLFFPFLLIALRRCPQRITLSILLAIGVGSFVLSEWYVQNYPSAAFFLLPMRAWELLLGSILVYFAEPRWMRTWSRELTAWSGLALIIAASVCFGSETRFPGLSAMLPCLGTFLIIYANSSQPTSLGKLLSNNAMVFIGLISYSLYLWHWPILAFLRYWVGIELPLGYRLGALVASFLVALASWRFVETPFRKGFARVGIAKLAVGAVCVAFFVVGVSSWVKASKGLPGRLPEHVRRIAAPLTELTRYQANLPQLKRAELPLLGMPREQEQSPDFLVWGDSHAMAAASCFHTLAQEHQLSGVMAAREGLLPVLGIWRPDSKLDGPPAVVWNDEVLAYIRQQRVKNVILVGRWAVNIEGRPNGKNDSLIAEHDAQSTNKLVARAALDAGLERTLRELHALGVKVWIMEQVPLQTFSPQRAIVRSVFLGSELPQGVSLETHDQRQHHVHDIITRQAANGYGAQVIDPRTTCFDAQGRSLLGNRNGTFYRDDDHLSDLGANVLLRPILTPVFDELVRSKSQAPVEALISTPATD